MFAFLGSKPNTNYPRNQNSILFLNKIYFFLEKLVNWASVVLRFITVLKGQYELTSLRFCVIA